MTKKTQFDIELLLPELPDEHDACAARLVDLMLEKKGIEKAHLREGNGSPAGEFCVHFDPAKISLTEVRSMATAAGAALDHRYGHLLLKTTGMSARRARAMRGHDGQQLLFTKGQHWSSFLTHFGCWRFESVNAR